MRQAIAVSMLATWSVLLLPQPRAVAATPPELVRCESSARETVRCKADTRRGVTLARQLSRAGCWYDETWGYDAKGIWVSNGCRADFALEGSSGIEPGAGTESSTSSGSGISGSDVAAGAAAALVIGAIAAAVIASGDDDDDDDDDDDRRYDCRRDRGGRCRDDDPWRRDRVWICESRGYKPHYCRVNTQRGVELRRQLGKSSCRYGKSWGYDRGGIWVDRGCRGEFLIRG
jgi:hypothetical protein